MACWGRLLSPIRASLSSISPSNPSLSLSTNSVIPRRFGLLKSWPKRLQPEIPHHAARYEWMSSMQREVIQRSKFSGRKLFVGSFLGLSVVTGMMSLQSNAAYAMDGDHHADFEQPSGVLKDDLHTFWALAKKFQLPAVLIITVFLGWRHPITLAINVALLLFCTRPSPFSVYIFIEQLRQRGMRQDPRLYKSKFFYAKKVEVKDYKLLCLANVELRDMKVNLIGILGGWWVFRSSQI